MDELDEITFEAYRRARNFLRTLVFVGFIMLLLLAALLWWALR